MLKVRIASPLAGSLAVINTGAADSVGAQVVLQVFYS